jgi:hypothetical protein
MQLTNMKLSFKMGYHQFRILKVILCHKLISMELSKKSRRIQWRMNLRMIDVFALCLIMKIDKFLYSILSSFMSILCEFLYHLDIIFDVNLSFWNRINWYSLQSNYRCWTSTTNLISIDVGLVQHYIVHIQYHSTHTEI